MSIARLATMCLAVIICCEVSRTSAAIAQEPQKQTESSTNPAVPSPEVLLMMIRTVMIASANAVTTGNFTVLRDLGTPTFAADNSPAGLGFAFKNLIDRRINLEPSAVVTPVLSVPPVVDDDQVLRIDGKFPTRPLEIDFRMTFRIHEGRWRLSGLAVTTSEQVRGPTAQR